MWPRICDPGRHVSRHAASPYRQSAAAKPSLASALWEQGLQTLENELKPAIAANRQQGDDLTTGGNDDGDDCSSRRVHSSKALISV